MMKAVKVFAPATIANLGSGFDVLGIAIAKPGDYVIAEQQRESGVNFLLTGNTTLKQDDENVAAYVARLMLEEFKPKFGVKLNLQKKMPIGSGLGSSGASSVAAIVAVNALLSKPLSRPDLLRFAIEGERKASGAAHADNVAPALLGGACLVRSYDPLDVVQLPIRNKVFWVVAHPHVVVRTEQARGVLPNEISLRSAVTQWGNVSGLTAGLMLGDANLVGKCVDDIVAEPVRANFIPGFTEVKAAALSSGALGCSISGSGPAVFAITPSQGVAERVAKKMMQTFDQIAKVKSDAYISRANLQGAKIIWEKNV